MPEEGHYTTAKDISIMSLELLKHPSILKYTGTYMETISEGRKSPIELVNHNKLVRFFDGCDGLKTGYTEEAKYCISATAVRDGVRMLAVIMGAPTYKVRNRDASMLMNYGFSKYEGKKIFSKDEDVEKIFLGKNTDRYFIAKAKTDLTIGLPENHIWESGASVDPNGINFNPNMPTEEIFTLPHKYEVNGVVHSTKPLVYGGNVIDDFSLTFKDGKIIDCSAAKGEETLKNLIATDEGSHYLGEVALVPHKSPISDTNIVFYNTLYDENASCHLALGSAYATCIKDGANLPREEYDKYGINDSLTHVDFMIGSPDLQIVGETHDGETVQIFKDGNWAF